MDQFKKIRKLIKQTDNKILNGLIIVVGVILEKKRSDYNLGQLVKKIVLFIYLKICLME